MKKLIILLAMLGLMGCSYEPDNKDSNIRGHKKYLGEDIAAYCVSGLKYLDKGGFWKTELVELKDKDGKPKTCDY